MGFPPGLFGNYPDRLLQLSLHFPNVRREYDFFDARDEHPEDPIPTSVMLVPPPTVSPSEKRQLRARFAAQKLVPEGEETPLQTPSERNLSAFGVTLSNWASWVLLRPLEIPVDMLCGQSQGDMAALCVAGATEFHGLADSFWASLEVPPSYAAQGHLALVGVSADRIAPFLAEIPDVFIAIHASRNHMVLGGSAAGLRTLAARLKGEGVEMQNFPYPPIHTPRLTYMRDNLRGSENKIPLISPKIPTYCSTAAELFSSDPDEIRASLMDNLDRPILWWQTYRKMYEDGARIFLQAGGTVANNVDSLVLADDRLALSIDASYRDPLTQLNHVCAALFTAGCRFRPAPLHRDREVRRLALGEPRVRARASATAMPMRLDPPWFEVLPGSPGVESSQPEWVPVADVLEAVSYPLAEPATDAPAGPLMPLVGEVLHFAGGDEIVAERRLTLAEDRYLADHYFIRAADHKPLEECMPVMPLAMAIEMISEVGSCLAPGLQFIGLEDVRASRWLALEDTDALSVQAPRAVSRRRPGHGRSCRRSGPVCARQRHAQHQRHGSVWSAFSPRYRNRIHRARCQRSLVVYGGRSLQRTAHVPRAGVPVRQRSRRTGRHGIPGRAHRAVEDRALHQHDRSAAADRSVRDRRSQPTGRLLGAGSFPRHLRTAGRRR